MIDISAYETFSNIIQDYNKLTHNQKNIYIKIESKKVNVVIK